MTLTSDPVEPAPGPAAPAPAPDPAGTGPASPEALIEEARQHQRRRWLWIGAVAVLVAVVAAAAGLAWAGGSGGPSRRSRAAHPVGSGAGPVRVRSLAFPGPFTPQQIVSAAGKVWLVGDTRPDVVTRRCAIESVDPTTLRTRRYPLSGCGLDVAVGGGQIYLSTLIPVPGTVTNQVRVERFDPASGRSTVLPPVDMTLAGDADGHTTMTYGDGSLWLWGDASRGDRGGGGDEVVQISPPTGAVVRTITGVPETASGRPFMVAAEGGLWLAGGPAGSATVDRLAWRTNAPSVAYTGPAHGSVLWLSAAGGRVWAAVDTYHEDDGQDLATTRLVALDAAGHQVAHTPAAPLGVTAPTGSGSQLWGLGSSESSCTGPLRLWRIDATTGAGRPVVTLPTPGEPCINDQGTAVAGPAVFALTGGDDAAPVVLYRVTG